MEKVTCLKNFEVQGRLGEGAFAVVYRVKRLEDGQIYAMKKINIGRLKEKERENALNEVRILASYSGEFIIGYKEAFYDDPSATLCIVMEYAAGGDILKLVQANSKRRTKIPESEIWKAMAHITQGLKLLHEKKILHRDLKCANIFQTDQGVYKLGDLNVSKVLKKELANTQTGTPYYASPEVWKDKPYGPKADMWSLGCVLYEMAAQRPPFTAPDLPGLYKKICSGYFPRIPMDYSNELAAVVSSLLKNSPDQRPSTQDLLSNQSLHKNYKGTLTYQAREEDETDFLLKTLKINHRNLKAMHSILPKANYNGCKSSRSRSNSIDKSNEQSTKTADTKEPTPQKKEADAPASAVRMSSEESQEKSRKAIENYLEKKRKCQQKEREKELERLKECKEEAINRRQRVLSACGMRGPSPAMIKQLLSPPESRLVKCEEPASVRPNRKDNDICVRLPPKPNLPAQNFKLPPRPSIPGAMPSSAQKDRSKESLQRVGQRLLCSNQIDSSHDIVKGECKMGRCNSQQRIVYPSWWMD